MYDDNDMIVIIINDDHVNVEDIDKLSNYYNGARNSNSNDDNTNGLHEIFNIMMIVMMTWDVPATVLSTGDFVVEEFE